jgi:hypothetical protein
LTAGRVALGCQECTLSGREGNLLAVENVYSQWLVGFLPAAKACSQGPTSMPPEGLAHQLPTPLGVLFYYYYYLLWASNSHPYCRNGRINSQFTWGWVLRGGDVLRQSSGRLLKMGVGIQLTNTLSHFNHGRVTRKDWDCVWNQISRNEYIHYTIHLLHLSQNLHSGEEDRVELKLNGEI